MKLFDTIDLVWARNQEVEPGYLKYMYDTNMFQVSRELEAYYWLAMFHWARMFTLIAYCMVGPRKRLDRHFTIELILI